LHSKARQKMVDKQKWETNADKISWAKEMQDLSNSIAALQKTYVMIEDTFKNK
jgi:hypothetical protein